MGKKSNEKDKKAKSQIEKIKEEIKAEPVPMKHVYEDAFTKPKALAFFEKEVDAIKHTELNTFFNNVLATAPASYGENEALLKEVRKAHDILKFQFDENDVDGIAKEALLGTVLICKILETDFKDSEYPNLFAIATRQFIEETNEHKVIPTNIFENIIRAIESHLGNKSPSLFLRPKAGTAEAEIANAFTLAKIDPKVFL